MAIVRTAIMVLMKAIGGEQPMLTVHGLIITMDGLTPTMRIIMAAQGMVIADTL